MTFKKSVLIMMFAALACVLLLSASPSHAYMGVGYDEDLSLAADRVCNGGSCLTRNGTVLNCPTSGGPTCGPGEACTCRCIRLPNGTYTAANHCGRLATDQFLFEE